MVDLATVSVLVDGGAGNIWKFMNSSGKPRRLEKCHTLTLKFPNRFLFLHVQAKITQKAL